MYLNERKTKFNMSYANLSGISRLQCDTILRDIVEFERFGISNADVEAFRSQVEVFDNTPIDEELSGIVIDLTIAKNELAEEVKTLIREVARFVKQVYKKQSGVYYSLSISDMSNKSDLQLLRTAWCVIRLVRLKAEELHVNAQDVADQLEAVNTEFESKIKAKDFAVQDRDMATDSRIELANSIYSKLIDFAELGAGIWAERNEAKYNDYIIYKTSSSKPPADTPEPPPEPLNGESEEGNS